MPTVRLVEDYVGPYYEVRWERALITLELEELDGLTDRRSIVECATLKLCRMMKG